MTRSLLSVVLVAALLVLPALPVLAGEGEGDRVAAAQEERAGDGRDGDGHQGSSPSDPDAGSNGGADKPVGDGGHDDVKDGNNGCGNDDDFEDDNNGRCGGPGRGLPPDDEAPREPTQGTAEEVPPRADDGTRVDTDLPIESPGTRQDRRVLRLLAATNAPNHHLAGDRTIREALFQGVVAFLEQRQLSLRIPVPRTRTVDDETMAAAGTAEQETTASEVLRTAAGALLLLTSLAIATLGAGSLTVGRTRP